MLLPEWLRLLPTQAQVERKPGRHLEIVGDIQRNVIPAAIQVQRNILDTPCNATQ